MDLLGPKILPTLWMKGQVLHRERAHLKVPGWSLVWNELQTEKLPMFLSHLNEISGGCDKILTISESFWSNLKLIRSLITDHYKPLKAVQHEKWWKVDLCLVATFDKFLENLGFLVLLLFEKCWFTSSSLTTTNLAAN